MRLHLWVLEDVLEDYSRGIVCVLAQDEAAAWDILRAKDKLAWSILRGFSDEDDSRPPEELPLRFRRVDAPEAFVIWGGS